MERYSVTGPSYCIRLGRSKSSFKWLRYVNIPPHKDQTKDSSWIHLMNSEWTNQRNPVYIRGRKRNADFWSQICRNRSAQFLPKASLLPKHFIGLQSLFSGHPSTVLCKQNVRSVTCLNGKIIFGHSIQSQSSHTTRITHRWPNGFCKDWFWVSKEMQLIRSTWCVSFLYTYSTSSYIIHFTSLIVSSPHFRMSCRPHLLDLVNAAVGCPVAQGCHLMDSRTCDLTPSQGTVGDPVRPTLTCLCRDFICGKTSSLHIWSSHQPHHI